LIPGANTNEDKVELLIEVALQGIAVMMSERMEAGKYGAFVTDDPKSDGYYLVEWMTPPYTLQDDERLEEYDPPIIIPKGELVCDAKYWSKVPGARQWYVPEEDSMTVVRVKQVIAPDIELLAISANVKLPNTCNKRAATTKQSKKIATTEHKTILDEISQREALDYNKEVQTAANEEAASLSSKSDGESDDSKSDDSADTNSNTAMGIPTEIIGV
jgi:hypothetical protein